MCKHAHEPAHAPHMHYGLLRQCRWACNTHTHTHTHTHGTGPPLQASEHTRSHEGSRLHRHTVATPTIRAPNHRSLLPARSGNRMPARAHLSGRAAHIPGSPGSPAAGKRLGSRLGGRQEADTHRMGLARRTGHPLHDGARCYGCWSGCFPGTWMALWSCTSRAAVACGRATKPHPGTVSSWMRALTPCNYQSFVPTSVRVGCCQSSVRAMAWDMAGCSRCMAIRA
jgi:hypothetical protein